MAFETIIKFDLIIFWLKRHIAEVKSYVYTAASTTLVALPRIFDIHHRGISCVIVLQLLNLVLS